MATSSIELSKVRLSPRQSVSVLEGIIAGFEAAAVVNIPTKSVYVYVVPPSIVSVIV